MVYRIKANHEIIRQYRCTVLLYFDWRMELKTTMHMIGCDWLMGWDTKCVTDRQTELGMAVNTCVAFATKNLFVYQIPYLDLTIVR